MTLLNSDDDGTLQPAQTPSVAASLFGFGRLGNTAAANGTALQAAVNASRRVTLPPSTVQFSGVINVPTNTVIEGGGSQVSILQATTSGTQLAYGPAVGSAAQAQAGVQRGWALDGNGIANQPCVFNAVSGGMEDVAIYNGVQGNLIVAGQNCVFTKLFTGPCVGGPSLALDNGAGFNVFLGTEINTLGSTAACHLEIRETVNAASYAYATPQQNLFLNGQFEGNVSLTSIHSLAGTYNRFEQVILYTPLSKPLVYFEPDTSNSLNGRMYFTACTFSAGTSGITASTSAINGDIVAILDSDNVFTGQSGGVAIPWPNTTPIRVSGSPVLYGSTTSLYSSSGSARKTPDVRSWSNLTLGTNISATAGYNLAQVTIENRPGQEARLSGVLTCGATIAQWSSLFTVPTAAVPKQTTGVSLGGYQCAIYGAGSGSDGQCLLVQPASIPNGTQLPLDQISYLLNH